MDDSPFKMHRISKVYENSEKTASAFPETAGKEIRLLFILPVSSKSFVKYQKN
jgi:hypothetical protein